VGTLFYCTVAKRRLGWGLGRGLGCLLAGWKYCLALPGWPKKYWGHLDDRRPIPSYVPYPPYPTVDTRSRYSMYMYMLNTHVICPWHPSNPHALAHRYTSPPSSSLFPTTNASTRKTTLIRTGHPLPTSRHPSLVEYHDRSVVTAGVFEVLYHSHLSSAPPQSIQGVSVGRFGFSTYNSLAHPGRNPKYRLSCTFACQIDVELSLPTLIYHSISLRSKAYHPDLFPVQPHTPLSRFAVAQPYIHHALMSNALVCSVKDRMSLPFIRRDDIAHGGTCTLEKERNCTRCRSDLAKLMHILPVRRRRLSIAALTIPVLSGIR